MLEMNELIKNFENKISLIIGSLKTELVNFRTNRPTPQLVEGILVDYSGQMLSIKQLGSISIQPPRGINITVWDKTSAPLISKAIEDSNLKLNASVDGNVVRINLPELTEERRTELVKVVKKTVENARIKIRTLRDDSNKEIDKLVREKTINEDRKFNLKKEVQERIDKTNKEICDILNNKIKEIQE